MEKPIHIGFFTKKYMLEECYDECFYGEEEFLTKMVLF